MVAYLNIHSAYDLLSSSLKIEDIVKKAVSEDVSAIALTDTNVLYGYPQFYDACLAHNIKPIFGMTLHVTNGLDYLEMVVLARNNEGLQALFQLSSEIKMNQLENVQCDLLQRYNENLIMIFKHVEPQHKAIVEEFKHHPFVYLDHLSISMDHMQHTWLQSIRYLTLNDADTLAAMSAIKNNQKLDLIHEPRDYGEHFITKNERQDLSINQKFIEETDKIAQLCNAELKYHQSLLPQYETPEEQPSKEYLWGLLVKKLEQLNLQQEQYQQRLTYEYQIITDMGFEDYFLIVSDLIHYAKTHDVMVGPGRGSSAGSLVSYLLGITTIDPIKFNLLFERFLNPERVTMPDIDIDFEDTRREKVIQYVQQKYGSLHVSGIVTFGHLLAKAVARDVGRIMGFDDITLNEISSLIPQKLGITLDEAYQNEKFKNFVHRNHRHERWFDLSKKLEGLPRHTSTHAAGIIINDQPLYDYVPLTQGDTGLLTQWTMTEDEKIGLLKIDFLGLRNLSIIHQIINQVNKDLDIHIDIEKIPLDDPKVFELLSKGDTTGIFQLESDGVRNVLKRLKPEHFEDIVAVTSLYRPGPMEEIPTYISRRHDPSKVQYLHPDLQPILKNTYGVIIYQEQIMQIASKFANFSYGEADILRRAMSKKNRAVLESERQHFIEGAIANGYSEAISTQIFDLILKFADYGFPRAHAVSYSKIAYIMTYLKVRFPNYFYANILSNVIGADKKTAQIIEEAKQQNIKILPPNINESHWFYKATPKGIFLSLGAIKGVGYQSVKVIVDERYQNGKFKDFFDFARRIPKRVKTKKLLEALILVGAFDNFNKTRATLLHAIDQVMDDGLNIEQENLLFDMLTPKEIYEEKEELSDGLISQFEKEYLGFYISKHPVEKMFEKKQYLTIYKLANAKNYHPILVQFDNIKQIRTKNGQNMAFVTLNDGRQMLDGVIFPDKYKKYETELSQHDYYIISGKFDVRNQQKQFIINDIMQLDHYEEQKRLSTKQIVIRTKENIDEFKEIIYNQKQHQIDIEIMFYDETTNNMIPIGYINQKESRLDEFIQSFKPTDIRLI
ncbi:DNA polymerase III subunit alpha [Staphylococcus simiae]|uniref:DNA polymerase III subunit alpha n=1 Tax=Staphylococcus simiae TaxID=308354 RepID=UPI001A96A7E0|nr:DNA polymerase III subunit alpha [Staphylococcus simiae]MBO1198500.1 DNA polymerase III subunit alpha [Staphylococcus simiae]MBO1201594.1 DNA polymerase III subunit alpha [Staphylococcus simiae]MBO1204257.1 DNA polymerase III subunit alpha [Staphylococcus simiae]MBO1210491.1 DNA polymerase III subunit alpha [Staphylococcus simiae]MBO1229955.1 DNA polymerase III subunit alpha [Staphylococcus simiae]